MKEKRLSGKIFQAALFVLETAKRYSVENIHKEHYNDNS